MKPFSFRFNGKEFEGHLLIESISIGEIFYVHLKDEELLELGGPHLLFYREIGMDPEFRYQMSKTADIRRKMLRHSIIDVLKDF